LEAVFEVDPNKEFFEATRSPLTKDRCERRLDLFFKHINADGSTLKQRAVSFSKKAKSDSSWVTFALNDFMRHQKSRAEKNEIAESTLANYLKPFKLFVGQNDILMNWTKIGRRVPASRSYSNDQFLHSVDWHLAVATVPTYLAKFVRPPSCD
jgi:hypothetical protein